MFQLHVGIEMLFICTKTKLNLFIKRSFLLSSLALFILEWYTKMAKLKFCFKGGDIILKSWTWKQFFM